MKKHKKRRQVPSFLRVIHKEDNNLSQKSKYGSNLRFLREQNFKKDSGEIMRREDDNL